MVETRCWAGDATKIPAITALRRWRQEDHEFSPAWATEKVPSQPQLYSKTLPQKHRVNDESRVTCL
jgi:hypothetical protein